MNRNITMKDIADELNVSTVTVSKALSGKRGVSEELRKKIKIIADDKGYRINANAKAMKEGINHNVGILVADRFFEDETSFYSKLYKMIIIELNKRKFSGILEFITDDDEKNGIMPNMLLNNKVDAVIIMGQIKGDYFDHIANIGIPYIFLDFYDEHIDIDSVISDSIYGSFLLTDYLISLGHKEIGFIGDILATSSILDRYLGYYKALLLKRLNVNQEWVIKDRDEFGKYIDIKLPQNMPSAFVCNCDEVAYIFIEKLKKEGYKVPEDISVVGFDDFIYATLSDPELTTYRVDLQVMADTAVDAIVRKVKDKSYSIGRKLISGDLVIRDSARNNIN